VVGIRDALLGGMNITPLETAVLDCIARNLYQESNGGVPDSYAETGAIWTWGILTDTTSTYAGTVAKRSLPGVIASLVKKGLVNSYQDACRRDDTVCLTEDGFKVWESFQANGKI